MIANIRQLPKLQNSFFAFFVIRTGFWSFLFFFGAFLVEKFHFDRTQAAHAYVIIALWTLVILNTVVKWAKRWFNTKQLIIITAVILAISILGIALSNQPRYIYWIIPFWTFGASGFYTYFLAFLSKEAGAQHQGLAMGIVTSLQSAAQIISPIIAGLIMSSHVNLPLLIGVALILLGAFIFSRANN